jgi:asparagine synthase (glutamine-hydrolysing)
LGDAVERQLVSDRPVGFYLSGGLDTSSVVALASEIADEPIHTFCMGFRDAAWDERPHAREVAEHFGTIHHELAIEDRFMRSFPEMIWHADEPKRNLYPYFVAEAMKQHVTVALGGLGADELFGGYVYRIQRLRELARMRAAAGVELRKTIRSLADERIDRQLDTEELRGDAALEDWGVLAHLDEDRQLYTVLNSVDVIGDDRVYRRRILGERLVEGTPAATQIAEYSDDDILSKMAVWDLTHKLPDDFLLVEDRMSMAHALESRVPFLDTELIELALSIPVDERVDGTKEASRMRRTGKGILREAMTGLVPRSVLERDKQGFTMPTSTFVEESLFDHAERILAAPTIARAGLIDPEYIRQLLAAGPDPALTHHHRMLWKLVALEIWHQMYIEGGKMAPPASIDSYAT